MSIIGNLGDPVKDVAALSPLAERLASEVLSGVRSTAVTDVEILLDGLGKLADGLTITTVTTITRKPVK